jgi:hypothetical protein
MKNLKNWNVEVNFKDGTSRHFKTSTTLNSNYRDILTNEIHAISEQWGLKNIISIKFTR